MYELHPKRVDEKTSIISLRNVGTILVHVPM